MTDKFQCVTCSFKGDPQKCQPLHDTLKTAGDYRVSEKDEAIELLEQCTSIIPCKVYSDEKIKNSDDNEWDTLPEECFAPLNKTHDTPSNEPVITPPSIKSTKSGSNTIAVLARIVFIIFIVGIVIGGSPSTLASITKLVGQTPTINVVGGVGSISDDVLGGDIMHQTINDVTGAEYVTKTEEYQTSPRTIVYPYVINGNHKTISFTTYEGLSTHFSKEDDQKPLTEDALISKLLNDKDQDEYMKPLVDAIKKESPNPDDQAKIAISLVQHIPYDEAGLFDLTEWYYPYETLYRNKGICEDKSQLLAYLLNKLGYDVVLFDFDQEHHKTVGIKSDPKYDYKDLGYAFIETTGPTIITDASNEYRGVGRLTTTPNIFHLNGGTKSLEVSNEYNDAVLWNQLMSQGMVLPTSQYNQWETLVNKYDIPTSTIPNPISSRPLPTLIPIKPPPTYIPKPLPTLNSLTYYSQ